MIDYSDKIDFSRLQDNTLYEQAFYTGYAEALGRLFDKFNGRKSRKGALQEVHAHIRNLQLYAELEGFHLDVLRNSPLHEIPTVTSGAPCGATALFTGEGI